MTGASSRARACFGWAGRGQGEREICAPMRRRGYTQPGCVKENSTSLQPTAFSPSPPFSPIHTGSASATPLKGGNGSALDRTSTPDLCAR